MFQCFYPWRCRIGYAPVAFILFHVKAIRLVIFCNGYEILCSLRSVYPGKGERQRIAFNIEYRVKLSLQAYWLRWYKNNLQGSKKKRLQDYGCALPLIVISAGLLAAR